MSKSDANTTHDGSEQMYRPWVAFRVVLLLDAISKADNSERSDSTSSADDPIPSNRIAQSPVYECQRF